MNEISKVLHPMIMHQIEPFEGNILVREHVLTDDMATFKNITHRLLSRRSRVNT